MRPKRFGAGVETPWERAARAHTFAQILPSSLLLRAIRRMYTSNGSGQPNFVSSSGGQRFGRELPGPVLMILCLAPGQAPLRVDRLRAGGRISTLNTYCSNGDLTGSRK
jgi:hypothetical protein